VAEPAEAASSLTGGGQYVAGTSVTLKTTTTAGWKFVNWTDEDGQTVSSPYTTKAKRETLTAHFEFDPNSPTEPGEIAENVRYWLTLAVEEGGTASGGGRYLAGSQNTVTATANAQYEFVGWYDSEGETCLTTNKSYKATMVRGGMTLLAKFKYVPDSPDEPGEILARGLNVMLGYYKNPEATAETIDHDGWYHTGDLGTMDAYGNVFINGRSKNMLLGANGQNIYPEEIEDKLNSMTMVVESIVVQRDSKLVALVYPDMDEAKNMKFSMADIKNVMEQNRNGLNEMLPAYEKISEIEIYEEEFEKTPKKSIKRYLYK
jgi:acyl-CoA synthetase (AMP-forming)/AMP-acid ligase II